MNGMMSIEKVYVLGYNQFSDNYIELQLNDCYHFQNGISALATLPCWQYVCNVDPALSCSIRR